jgi:uncharacterized protein YjbI with pentapeptide repeats
MRISAPIAPRLAAAPTIWDGEVETETEIDDARIENTDFSSASRLSIGASHIQRATLTGTTLDRLELTDAICVKVEAAALSAYKANLLRVHISDTRFTGAEFAEGHFEDCVFRNVKLDEAGFRFAHFKRVRFENCMLRQADFSGAKLAYVTFDGCGLEGANFVSAACSGVDISGEDLTGIKGILGLKGATISTEQLMQLAPLLASELGFRVKE